jgi:hypothetical protein
MRKFLLLLGLIAAPATANATPVYLSCSIKDAAALSLTVDEPNSLVTVMVDKTPAPQRLNAAFAATVVTFGNRTVLYTLDRRTLALVRKVPSMGWVDHGQCRIEKVTDRAF